MAEIGTMTEAEEAREIAPPPSLKEQLFADQQRRVEQFRARFVDLCDDLECDLIAKPSFSEDGRVIVNFVVQPR